MKQTNGVTTVISHEQSDLVTSATSVVVGGQKEPMKNGKSVIIANNNNKTKITSLITDSNSNSKSNNNINNNNTNITNKNKITAKAPTTTNGNNNNTTEMIVTSLQQQLHHKTKSNGVSQSQTPNASCLKSSSTTTALVNGNMKINPSEASTQPDVRAKQVLKEAVDAVVNSFTKHTQGYGRGECEMCKMQQNAIHSKLTYFTSSCRSE